MSEAERHASPAALVLVPTPIGNLEDMTLRALRALKEASTILAEDTRRTRGLLTHFGITTRLESFHDHSPASRVAALVDRMRAGERIALVTDAGMPSVSDPGLVVARAALEAGLRVEALPGASAVTTAWAVSALPTPTFVFWGFAPRTRTERLAFVDDVLRSPHASVFFESPQRLADTLTALEAAGGAERDVVVCRELTKLHETVLRGRCAEVRAQLEGGVRGEVTVIVAGASLTTRSEAPPTDDAAIAEAIVRTANSGLGTREIAAHVAKRFGLSQRDAYARVLKERRTDESDRDEA